MTPHGCCGAGSHCSAANRSASPPPQPGIIRRGIRFIRWITPGAILVLLPKCPMCLAAWVALGTGIGLSLPAARFLRILLIVLCTASLAYLLLKRVWPLRKKIAAFFTAR
ncbi:hypothetical protein LX66_3979 [Chitinophaga japonensis]|uniref:Uncharacterized protein n=2 Tax=Chitinophaga japonensis TaxID=104662 RepID=A0A562T107_CHIJA|nr:hypothetical protein LX66_3979 [Chitinophaga japonensis]